MAALYQSARPATFAEVVGQEHVKDVLLAALERGSTSHAYLFSGPRGVGKTTTARLLAMALNCESDSAGPRPCGNCDGCRMVREGHHPDVIELDAASNNSVDDVRDLREKTSLASMRGGSRVWILDEAHMLSKAAANALLKTLEEPPPGLVFVLATTEPEKLPPTVLSRCQHFRFRRHTEAEILGKLERLCAGAVDGAVEAEPEALALLARAADGSMRDAESLLERLLTPGAKITLAAAEDALGLPPVHRMQRLAGALASGDLETLLGEAEALYRDGFAPRSLADNLGTVLRDALRAEVGGFTGSGEGSAGDFRLPLERASLLLLIHALDEEQERFIRRDDLYSLEVALLKGLNAITGNVPASAAAAGDSPSAGRNGSIGADTSSTGKEKALSEAPAAGPVATGPAAGNRAVGNTAGGKTAAGKTADGKTAGGKTAGGKTASGKTAAGEPPLTEPAAVEPDSGPAESEPVHPSGGADDAGSSDGLPSFDPTGRGPATGGQAASSQAEGQSGASRGAGRGAARGESEGTTQGESEGGAKARKLDWHAVRSAAGPQLKAFLMPARESVEGSDVVIRYGDNHKFHYTELMKRQSELANLIEQIGGPGYRLTIEGPGDSPAKKS